MSPAAERGAPASSFVKLFGGAAAGGCFQHGACAYEDSHHVSHEGVCGDAEGEDVFVEGPGSGEDVAVEADVLGLGWGEGGEVVRSRESRCAWLSRASRSMRRRRGDQRWWFLLEGARCWSGSAGGSGSCATWRLWRASKPSSTTQAAVTATSLGPTPLSRRARSCAEVRVGDEARDLPERMHPVFGVRPATVSFTGLPQHGGQRSLELPLHVFVARG